MNKSITTQMRLHCILKPLLLMFLVLSPGVGWAEESNVPSLDDDGYYEINNVEQLKWFRDLVNGNLTDGTLRNSSANAILMADIDLNNEVWEPIGKSDIIVYEGVFDGGFHTISNLNVETGDYRGFIGFSSGGMIKCLGIINATVKGNTYVGVIAGYAYKTTIWKCWTSGTLDLSANYEVAGIANMCSGKMWKCNTSYSTVGRDAADASTIEECTPYMRSDALKTGEAAYLTGWGQTIGVDNHPVAPMQNVNIVYRNQGFNWPDPLKLGTTESSNRMLTLCYPREVSLPDKVIAFTVTGTKDGNAVLSKLEGSVVPVNTPVLLLNTGTVEATVSLQFFDYIYQNYNSESSTAISQKGNILVGTFEEFGGTSEYHYMLDGEEISCKNVTIPAYQCYMDCTESVSSTTFALQISEYLEYPSLNNDGYYEINNVEDLKWFRDLVNNSTALSGAYKSNAKLMADIDLNNETWTPIGNTSHYEGSFDGNFHTISNLCVGNGARCGFIGTAASDAKIKNLGVVNATINNGFNVGVIVGYADDATIQNCWTSGTLKLSAVSGGSVAGIANMNEGTMKNCHTSYSTVGVGADSETCKAGLATNAHETGELAFLLYSNKGDDTGWGQTIGVDEHPVALISTNQVYQYSADATTITMGADYSDERMTTLCFPADITLPEGVKAFTVTELKDNSKTGDAIMSELEGSVMPANTPVILMNTGTKDASIELSAVTYYSNEATTPTAITQSGNLLKGTYSQISSSQTKYAYYTMPISFYRGTLVSAYQCYIEGENENIYCYYPVTNKPLGEIEYTVLSGEDKTCYVSRLFYTSIGTSDYTVSIPSTTQIDGEDYTVVQLGKGTGDVDKVRFCNMNANYNYELNVNLPKTIKTVSKSALSSSGSSMNIKFFTEEAPKFTGSDASDYDCKAYVEVPYGAENLYKTAWGDGDMDVSSRKTEVDIANGSITVNADGTYKQGEGAATAINGTLVIKGDPSNPTTNNVAIEGGSNDEPLRIAINNLTISGSTADFNAMTLADNANVSLIVQGTNTLTSSDDSPCINLGDNASLVINPLSTGTINDSNGISDGNVTVTAKVYSGSSDCTTLNVGKNTSINTDKNELAFINNNFLTGVDNLVYNGTCDKFILNDAIDVYSPSKFTAKEVTYRRKFGDNEFNSLYLPFNVSVDKFTDCEFYLINMFHQSTNDDGTLNSITLEVSKVPSSSILKANHPYLFKYKGTSLNTPLEFNLTNVDVESTTSETFTCSSMSYTYEFTGYYQERTSTNDDDYTNYYVIGVDDDTNQTSLMHPKASSTLPAMRWAMKMTPRESQLEEQKVEAPARVPIIIRGEGDLTGISSVKNSEAGSKAIYGINGVRKSQMTKGLNIIRTADGRVVKIMKR